MRGLLVRGMIAGLVAGVVYFGFAWLFGGPSVEAAIGYEQQVAAAAGEISDDQPLVTRGVQATLGLAVAALVYGAAIGGLLALVHAAAYGRLWRLTPRANAAVLALLGFLVLIVVPFLKYPANPPASSIDDTIADRTGLYLVMVIISVVLAVAATALAQRLTTRLGTWNATLLAAAAYLVTVGITATLLPTIAETPPDFPATVLYQFRLASLGGHLIGWTTLGLVFGALIGRNTRHPSGAGRSVDTPAN